MNGGDNQMSTMGALVEQKALLPARDSRAAVWAEALRTRAAFNQAGNLLASGRETACVTEDGKLMSGEYSGGTPKEELPGGWDYQISVNGLAG